MASAICTACGGRTTWLAKRGARLAEVASPCCGARMRGVRRDDPPASELRTCLVCGAAYRPDAAGVLDLRDRHWLVCRRHEPADVEAAIEWHYGPQPWPPGYLRERASEVLEAYRAALAAEAR